MASLPGDCGRPRGRDGPERTGHRPLRDEPKLIGPARHGTDRHGADQDMACFHVDGHHKAGRALGVRALVCGIGRGAPLQHRNKGGRAGGKNGEDPCNGDGKGGRERAGAEGGRAPVPDCALQRDRGGGTRVLLPDPRRDAVEEVRGRLLPGHPVVQHLKTPLPGRHGLVQGAFAPAPGIDLSALLGAQRSQHILGRQPVDVVLVRH